MLNMAMHIGVVLQDISLTVLIGTLSVFLYVSCLNIFRYITIQNLEIIDTKIKLCLSSKASYDSPMHAIFLQIGLNRAELTNKKCQKISRC